MTHETQNRKGTFSRILRFEMFALILVMAYYVVTEHLAHLIGYTDFLLFGIVILLFAPFLWQYRQYTPITIKERNL